MSTNGPLVWMDMEMSGLNPERDVILEIATLITDADLNILAEGPEIVVQQPAELFVQMDAWCQEHHTKSGLWQRVIESNVVLAEAEKQTLEFVKKYCKLRESPLCGNSIWQDRRFLARYMPSLDTYLHYRIIDVSSIKELVARWTPQHKFPSKKGSHRALDDIRESLEELKHYRSTIFKIT